MIFKKALIILFLIFSIFPTYRVYAQVNNTGFVPGSIWYSIDPLKEGDKVKIYTFIFNGDKRELSGTVTFFDKDILLGKRIFAIPGTTAKDIFIDWTVTVGSHSIFAKIENAKFLISKGKYQDANLSDIETKKDLRIINKKITLENGEAKTVSSPETNTTGIDSVENIKKIIGENTPEIIAKPIISIVTTTENFRSSVGLASETKKEEVKSQIKVLKEAEIVSGEKENSMFLKPFKYVELFLFTLFSFIFNNKLMFYGSVLVIIFLILRFIWHRIF